MTGCFITLEGGEGAGKTTLAANLRAALESRGLNVVLTREPGGTPGAEAIRELLLNGPVDRWSAMSEALLFYAARVDHVERVIAPALARGDWVISDRFADSTAAYQSAAGGLDPDRLRRLHETAMGGFKPDVTLVIDIDPDIGIARTRARGEAATRFEKHAGDFHHRLRACFLDIARADPARCAVIDSSRPQAAVLADALAAIDARTGKARRE